MPAEKPSQNPNPPFRTPNPQELQSEEQKSAVQETLAQEQGGETDVVDPNDPGSFGGDSVDQPTSRVSSMAPPD
jgi:hypothetical protein